MISKRNIKYWADGDLFYAEWADRALDDDERYREDAIIFTASVPRQKYEQDEAKKAVTEMFNEWEAERL